MLAQIWGQFHKALSDFNENLKYNLKSYFGCLMNSNFVPLFKYNLR